MTCLRPLGLIGLSLSGYWCIGNSLGYRGYYENSNRAIFQDGKSLRYENLSNLTQRNSNGSGMNWNGKTMFYACLLYINIYIYIYGDIFQSSIGISRVESKCPELYAYINVTTVQIDKMRLTWDLSIMKNMLYIHSITHMKTLLW